jgi:hypothetical protein
VVAVPYTISNDNLTIRFLEFSLILILIIILYAQITKIKLIIVGHIDTYGTSRYRYQFQYS